MMVGQMREVNKDPTSTSKFVRVCKPDADEDCTRPDRRGLRHARPRHEAVRYSLAKPQKRDVTMTSCDANELVRARVSVCV